MLKIELNSEPGGITARWHNGAGLTLHRRDGSIIMHINVIYADERALMTAAHALNFMFKSIKNAKTRDDRGDSRADRGDSPES